MGRPAFINIEFASVVEAVEQLRMRLIEDGKEPTHIVCTEILSLQLGFECSGKAYHMKSFNGMQVVVIEKPENFITLGTSIK